MIRRIVCLILGMMIVLSGCSGTSVNGPNGQEQGQEVLNFVPRELSQWEDEKPPFVPSQYQAQVATYQVAADLGNIDNLDMFQGLSPQQKEMLQKNGFIVLEPNPDRAHYHMKMYDIYEENEYKQIPNFITVDVALHLYHKVYDEALKGIERQLLHEDLKALTKNMLEKALLLHEKGNVAQLQRAIDHNVVYFAVANYLLNHDYGQLPPDLLETAKAEVALIQDHQGYANSPLFGFDVNYQQFIPRGHYEGDSQLEEYFAAMMWYGLIGHPFYNEKGDYDWNSIENILTTTYLAFGELDGKNDIVLWDRIYSPTNFFVGQSDDITLIQMKELMVKVYGEKPALADLMKDQYREDLKKAIDALPGPRIQHQLVTGTVNTPTEKQFRFMGQRYTLDANVLQEFMVPITRPVPSGLDVAAAFGSERAATLAKKHYLMDWTEAGYDKELASLRDKVKGLTEEEWQQNLYHGWLWSLKALWEPRNLQGMPLFMQGEAWQDKTLQSGLGSYAELKHDTVLYSKQPVAEMGGGEELKREYMNYVEPQIEVYDRLLWLVKYSKLNLEKRGLLTDSLEHALGLLEETYQLFIDCSLKELRNEPLTQKENEALRYIGGKMEAVDNYLADQFNQPRSSAVIADVAGIADVGASLEVGTGLSNEIIVALNHQGTVYLARGVVYSYYEFLNPTPLTDLEWHHQLGIERVEEGEYSYERINAERLLKDAPPQPQWIGSFKSFEPNQVELKDVLYEIGN